MQEVRHVLYIRVGRLLSGWFPISHGVSEAGLHAVAMAVQCIHGQNYERGEGKTIRRCTTTTLVQMLLIADDLIVCTERTEDMERDPAGDESGAEEVGDKHV